MMTVDEAIAKAEQWRKEGACGPAGLVAIALLDELESARATMTKHEQEITALHAKLAGETLRADQGWQRYEAANKARIEADALLSKAIPEWQPIETVPLEGVFLVYMPKERTKIQVMNQNQRVTVIGNSFAFDLTPPTHWMPLPAAPSVEGEE